MLLIGLAVLVFVLVGCAPKTEDGTVSPDTTASLGASAPADASPDDEAGSDGEASPSPSPSPSPRLEPDSFVMGRVTAINGDQITLEIVNPSGTKTIRVDENTDYSIAGSTKNAELADIAVGDVISATLNGDLALKIIDNGTDVNPDPSAYISPSPTDTESPSPSA